MKSCTKCGTTKSEDCFGKAKNTKDGLQGWCKGCMAEYAKAWRPKIVTAVDKKDCYACGLMKPAAEFSKNARAADGLQTMCKHCTKAYHADPDVRRKNNDKQNARWKTGGARDARYRKLFGISLEEYNRMFAEQGGVCKICLQPQDGLTKNLAVDHCHKTGMIRGLLCKDCNIGLGAYKDNKQLLEKAIAYLTFYENLTPGEP